LIIIYLIGKGKGAVDEALSARLVGITSNYLDEICESEKVSHIFAEIKNSKVRKEIAQIWKKSKKLCAQRKAGFIVEELAFGKKISKKIGKKIAQTIEKFPAKSVDDLNKKIAELADEEKKRFGIRKALQVRGGGLNKIKWRMEFKKINY
jgi:hypothetical protein